METFGTSTWAIPILKQFGVGTNGSFSAVNESYQRQRKKSCCHFNVRGRPALGKEDAFLFAETIGVSGGVGFPLLVCHSWRHIRAVGCTAAALLRLVEREFDSSCAIGDKQGRVLGDFFYLLVPPPPGHSFDSLIGWRVSRRLWQHRSGLFNAR